MTAVAIWVTNELTTDPCINVAADSLITDGSASALIKDASKVFLLPVTCRALDLDGQLHVSTQTYGYAFAGSTLLGQNTYLALAPLLSSLISQTAFTPPLSAVAAYIHDYLRSVYENARMRGPAANFEVALFGYCPVKMQLAVYHFAHAKTTEGTQMLMSSYEPLANGEVVYLGSYKDDFLESLRCASVGPPKPGRHLHSMPRYIVEEFVTSPERSLVGGDLQLWVASSKGLFPRMLVRPLTLGKPQSEFRYLGRPLTGSLLHVGEATIGMLGVA